MIRSVEPSQTSFAGDESVEVRHLRAATDALRQRLSGYERDGAPEGIRHHVGLQRMVEQLGEMEPRAQRSVWILQPRYFWDPEDPGVELTYGTQARGVTTLLITRPATLQVHPLLPSIFPTTRVAPVFLGAMVVDEHEAMIAGEDSGLGERTVWVTEREDIVAAVLHIWNLTLELSVPILPPGPSRRSRAVSCGWRSCWPWGRRTTRSPAGWTCRSAPSSATCTRSSPSWAPAAAPRRCC